jgi:hypothetical protein
MKKNARKGTLDKYNLRQDITLESSFVPFIVITQLTTSMFVWTVEFLCWLSWPLTLVLQSGGRKLTYIMTAAIHNLCVEYGHTTLKQTYGSVLNNSVKVTNSFECCWPSLM